MQNGMSLLLRGEGQAAFESFECAFSVIGDLLKDSHPMSLAQYMAILCEIASNPVQSLLFHLVKYTKDMAAIY
jgi:hypothetical protein